MYVIKLRLDTNCEVEIKYVVGLVETTKVLSLFRSLLIQRIDKPMNIQNTT